MDGNLLLILLFCLGFIVGFMLSTWKIRNKIKDVLDELKIHYKVLDEEQYKLFADRYGINKDSWMVKGIKKVKEKRKDG